MKFIIRIILIAGLSYAAMMVLPWWGVAVAAALISFLIPGHGFNVFVSGFLGVGLLWLAYAWKVDVENNSIISEKVVTLFPVSDVLLLVIATGVIGGIVGAFSSLTGNTFRQIFMKKKKKSYYN